MKRLYTKPEWIEFREEVFEADGFKCRECGRSRDSGAILQVHHLEYKQGVPPWAYAYSSCKTLCKACHAAAHGLIPPITGWTFLFEEDLGGLEGECDSCQTELRYLFYIGHPDWGTMCVGTDCCDRLTGSSLASDSRKRATRLENFIHSPRWKWKNGFLRIRQKRMTFKIEPVRSEYSIWLAGCRSKKLYPSLPTAQTVIFEKIESGECEAFVRKKLAAE